MQLDMTKGKPFNLLVKFLIPIVIGNVCQQLYSLIDTIIVGRYVGVDALASVGATGSIVFLILGFLMGLTTGVHIRTAQRFGADDIESLKSSVANGAILTLIVTISFTIISLLSMDFILTIMNTPLEIFDMAKEYISIICAGMFFTVLYNFLASALRAVGNSKIPLFFLMLSAIINVFLDLVFILSFNLGVAGAGYATIISQAISGILCLIYICKKIDILKLSKNDFKLDLYCMSAQLRTGVPMALQFSITAIGTMIVQSSLNILGPLPVASFTASSKIEILITQPLVALGVAMATYSAQNRGKSDYDRIFLGVKIANIMSCFYAILIYIVTIPLIPFIIPFFVTEDISQIIAYSSQYLSTCGTCFIPLGMIFIYRNTLQGCGYSFAPMFGGVIETIVRTIMSIYAAKMMSFTGICLATAITWLVTGIYLLICYKFTFKKYKLKN